MKDLGRPSGRFFSINGNSDALEATIDDQAYRTRLRDLRADEARPPAEMLQALLRLGAEWLGLEHGHLTRIDLAAGTHTIVEVSGPHPVLEKGRTCDLSTTYCRHVVARGDALAVGNAPEQGWNRDPAYEAFELSAYFGAKVVVENEFYGTLCFVDREPQVESFGESDAAVLALLVRAVEQTLERRRTGKALQEKEGRLRGLANSLPGVTYQFYARPGEDWGYHFVGQKAESVLGLSAEPEGFHDRFIQCIPPEYREQYVENTRTASKELCPARIEMPFDRPDGTRIWLLCSSMPERREDEILFNGVLLDITDRKEAEQALQAERDRFETLFHNLPTPVVHGWPDDDGRVRPQNVNDTFETVFGIDKDHLRTEDLRADIVPPDAQDDADSIRRWLQNGEPVDREVQRETSRGIRDFRVQVTLREDESGPVEGYAIYTDITERKRRERTLQDRQEKVEALYATTAQVLRAEDEAAVAQCIVDLVNEVFGYPIVVVRFREDHRLTPVQASPNISDHLPELSSLDVTSESVVATAFRDGDTTVFDDLRAADDAADPGAVRATAIVPVGMHGTISVAALEAGAVEDFDRRLIEILSTYAALVLDRITYEGELVSAKEEAERLNRMKSAFLANMSHEIRTPLTSIIGFAEVIGDEVASLSGRSPPEGSTFNTLHQFSELIEESGHRLLETLDAVLNLSRLEAGEMELDCIPLNLTEEVREAAGLFEPQAHTEGIDLQVETPDAPLWACVDEGGLRIVLQNLISNALKYTEEGGAVHVRADGDDDAVVLEVEDTGVGMDPGRVPELFEPFRQESEGPGRTYEGTGLGLAVTKQATEQMGGTIAVETAKGQGSCFTVQFPATAPPDRA